MLNLYTGKEAAKVYLGKKKTGEINYGLQSKSIKETKLYCAPSTSVKAVPYWDASIWQNLLIYLK